MRIVIDLDGTICTLKKEGETYANVKPIPKTIRTIKKLKRQGHYIIIYTARHMKTCEGDTGKILARVGKITLDWLERYDIPYDEIHFGKPNADIYIDDQAVRFKGWDNIKLNLPENEEK